MNQTGNIPEEFKKFLRDLRVFLEMDVKGGRRIRLSLDKLNNPSRVEVMIPENLARQCGLKEIGEKIEGFMRTWGYIDPLDSCQTRPSSGENEDKYVTCSWRLADLKKQLDPARLH